MILPRQRLKITCLMRMIREISDDTQIILITHANRTLEAAMTMYGATTWEQRVSKPVSVKCQEAQPPPPGR